MKKAGKPDALGKAEAIIQGKGGILRTAEAYREGIHSRTLRRLLTQGRAEKIARGVYRLTEKGPLSEPDLVVVAARMPQAVVCLVSSLAFHGLTTQIPRAVSVALPPGAETPRLDFPPVSVHRFSAESFREGVEEHRIDGAVVRIYSREKTLADCFKFRNKIGFDVVLEALKLYRRGKQRDFAEVLRFAGICRVEKAMKPYIEALL